MISSAYYTLSKMLFMIEELLVERLNAKALVLWVG